MGGAPRADEEALEGCGRAGGGEGVIPGRALFFLNSPSMPLVRPDTALSFCAIIAVTSMLTWRGAARHAQLGMRAWKRRTALGGGGVARKGARSRRTLSTLTPYFFMLCEASWNMWLECSNACGSGAAGARHAVVTREESGFCIIIPY